MGKMAGRRFKGKASGAIGGPAASTTWNSHSNMFAVLGESHAVQPIPPLRLEPFADNAWESTAIKPQSSTASGHEPSSPYTENRNVSHLAWSRPSTASTIKSGQPLSPRVSALRSQVFMKQSCLPVEDRNSNILDAERNRGRVIAKEAFQVGMIIRGIHHEGLYNNQSTTNVTDMTRTDTRHGPICTKYRKMTVIALHHDHFLAIPLFTHNFKGLQEKGRPDEFVSVCDHRVRDPSTFEGLSKHQPLWTEKMNPGIGFLDVKCTAHITYPISRSYRLPIIQEGRLTAASTNRLILYYNKLSPKERG